MFISNRLKKIEDALEINKDPDPARVMVVIKPHLEAINTMTTNYGSTWHILPGETQAAFHDRAIAEARAASTRVVVYCTFSNDTHELSKAIR